MSQPTKDDRLVDDRLVMPVSDRDHLRGSTNAPITLVEYGDYECPDCEHAAPIVNQLRAQFADKLLFVFRHFPQSAIHPHASAAAQAAEAAGTQGKFWEMHDVLFLHQRDLIDHDLTHFALLIGLEIYRFEAEVAGERSAARIREDYETGVRSGVKGTPTFFINGVRYRGPATVEHLANAMAS